MLALPQQEGSAPLERFPDASYRPRLLPTCHDMRRSRFPLRVEQLPGLIPGQGSGQRTVSPPWAGASYSRLGLKHRIPLPLPAGRPAHQLLLEGALAAAERIESGPPKAFPSPALAFSSRDSIVLEAIFRSPDSLEP